MNRVIFVKMSKDTITPIDVGPLDDDGVRRIETMLRHASLEQRLAFARMVDVLRSSPCRG